MPTPRRNFIDNHYYHAYNRGNHRDPIFHTERDNKRFLRTLGDEAARNNVEVAAYCLMPNHYHLLFRQLEGGSIQGLMTSLAVIYVKYYNKRYDQSGRLFQERYQAREIRNEPDLVAISRYIHRNPVKFGSMETYQWSSYGSYVGQPDGICSPRGVLDLLKDLGWTDYATFCALV